MSSLFDVVVVVVKEVVAVVGGDVGEMSPPPSSVLLSGGRSKPACEGVGVGISPTAPARRSLQFCLRRARLLALTPPVATEAAQATPPSTAIVPQQGTE